MKFGKVVNPKRFYIKSNRGTFFVCTGPARGTIFLFVPGYIFGRPMITKTLLTWQILHVFACLAKTSIEHCPLHLSQIRNSAVE